MYKSFSSRWRSEDTYENTYLYTMYQGFFKSWTSEATHFACTHCSKDVYQTVHLMGPCAQRQTLFLNLEIWSYIWKCFASRQCSKALSLNIWSSIWEHTREKHLHVYNVQKLFLILLIWRVKWKKTNQKWIITNKIQQEATANLMQNFLWNIIETICLEKQIDWKY